MDRWIILKGWHYSLSNIWRHLIPRIGTKPITYNFMFEKADWFPYKDSDDLDINKLAGFSYGLHHKNSVRIGWTPLFSSEGNFTLFFYLYNNGERTYNTFANIRPGTEYSLTISFKDDKVFFEMTSEKSKDTPVKANMKFILPGFRIGYRLWPYFGGNKPAPKRMVFYVS